MYGTLYEVSQPEQHRTTSSLRLTSACLVRSLEQQTLARLVDRDPLGKFPKMPKEELEAFYQTRVLRYSKTCVHARMPCNSVLHGSCLCPWHLRSEGNFERLKKDAQTRSSTLFILIADECHFDTSENGSYAKFINDIDLVRLL